MLKILYIGDSNPNTTSYHRAQALRRVGYQVELFDLYALHKQNIRSALWGVLHYRTGYVFLQSAINKSLQQFVSNCAVPDLIWVNGGELLGKRSISILRNLGAPVILYNNDDPTGNRDGNRFKTLLRAIPSYDLCVVMREVNVQEYMKIGARRVYRTYMSYDEIQHAPIDTDSIPVDKTSDVAFIGTWMRNEGRDEFLAKLIDLGLNVSIWGGRWQKSRLWPRLERYYKGSTLSGKDYVAAIQGAKITIGLLSKGNRDLYTTRSSEIPYIGGLFCAERTDEHLKMYRDGEEAVFWNDAEECARLCKKLLADEALRSNIRLAGKAKVAMLKIGNEDICRKIIAHLLEIGLLKK